MKFLPTTNREWLRLWSVPFKIYVIEAALIYDHYRSLMPGRPGMIGGYELTVWMTGLSLGYYVSFIALLVVASSQRSAADRLGAVLSMTFALVALYGGYELYPPTLK